MNNLSGDKNTDYEILYNLSDYDLGNICKVNRYTRELCKNDMFWMNRTMKRFVPVFESFDKLKKYKELYSKTWREYYIDLVNYMELYYEYCYRNKYRNREDYYIIDEFKHKNTEKYVDCYLKNPKCSLDLNADFIDLNNIFEEIINTEDIIMEEILEIIIKILKIPSFNISVINIDLFLSFFKEIGLNSIIEYKNVKYTRKGIMEFVLDNGLDKISYFDILFPHIADGYEILDNLFDYIRNGNYILDDKKKIKFFLDAAIKKGSSKADIEKYYEESKGLEGKVRDMGEDVEIYNDNMKVVRKYLKTEGDKKDKKDKKDKLALIYEKLQNNVYSDKVYNKILMLL
jgi:hypothetical protein